MSHSYVGRKQAEKPAGKTDESVRGPSMDALLTGAAAPSAGQKGRRVDLPEAMRSKMESAFGADLSDVRLYESQTVADAGAQAVAQGRDIAFAPGMLDFTSFGGQALLGHEISHVVSQARGEVMGGGFLNDHALEARADREGAMAAAGQQISMPTSAMSPVSAAPAAGPMQAGGKHKGKKYERFSNTPEVNFTDPEKHVRYADTSFAGSAVGKADHRVGDQDTLVPSSVRPGRRDLEDRITAMLNSPAYHQNLAQAKIQNSTGDVDMAGSGKFRMIHDLLGSQTMDMSDDEIVSMVEDLYAPNRAELHQPGATKEQIAAGDEQFDRGMHKLKDVYYKQLKRIEATYGTLPTQMHPEDFLSQVGPEFFEQNINQDWMIFRDKGRKYLDPKNKQDQEFERLLNYYTKAQFQLFGYGLANGALTGYGDPEATPSDQDIMMPEGILASEADEAGIGGPRMSGRQARKYKKGLRERAKGTSLAHKLFGRFK